MFGEKLLELANYAVAALIFGQLVGAQRISLALMLTGGASYIALVVVADWRCVMENPFIILWIITLFAAVVAFFNWRSRRSDRQPPNRQV